jgi:fumarate reductase subunit C
MMTETSMIAKAGWLDRILARPAVAMLVIGVLLPNILFAILALIGFSIPPRTLPIMGYVFAACSLRFLPSPLVALLYLAALFFDIVHCATQFFGLAPQEALFALQFINELDIINSHLYVVLVAAVTATTGFALYLLIRHGRRFKRGTWSLMLLGGMVTVPADIAVNMPRHSVFYLNMGRDLPFESAADSSGYRDLMTKPNGHHMLVVIVEAMGHFADPANQKLLSDAFAGAAFQTRYQVTAGKNSHLGSTTAGEMRELCGTRQSYISILETDMPECAPFRLQAAGYETTGYHGFAGNMFERLQWWPHIGLQNQHFAETLVKAGDRQCGDVFTGACDPELVKVIASQIKQAATPQFVYFLTVNTHVPVIVDQGYGHLDCRNQGGPMREREVCIMTDGWIELFQGIATALAAPDMPPVEVLIVGDHAPPLWHRQARDLFESGQVGWYRLTPR